MVGEFSERSFQPLQGFYTSEFACTHEGIEHGGTLSRFMAARKEVILPSQGNRAYHIFHKVIIYFQLAVCCINAEFYPPAQRILNGFSNEEACTPCKFATLQTTPAL
jgi:hypothetical protein